MPLKPIPISRLPLAALDENSPVPLYHQIELDLRQLIRLGTLKPGDILPPEHELCKAYRVGRHTVRMALARVAADGLLERQAGRGTIVKPGSDRQEFHLDRSFTRQMAEIGIRAHSRVLRAYLGLPTQTEATTLPLKVGTHHFFLERVRFGGDEPVGLQATVVAADLCPGIEVFDFSQRSLYDVLTTEYRLEISRITHGITAVIADEYHAGLLQVAPGSPLMRVKTTAYLDNEQVIETTLSYYRADKYEFTTTEAYPHAHATRTRLASALR